MQVFSRTCSRQFVFAIVGSLKARRAEERRAYLARHVPSPKSKIRFGLAPYFRVIVLPCVLRSTCYLLSLRHKCNARARSLCFCLFDMLPFLQSMANLDVKAMYLGRLKGNG